MEKLQDMVTEVTCLEPWHKLFKHTFEQKKKMFTVNEEEYEKMLRGLGNNP